MYVLIFFRILGDTEAWNRLMRLATERETATTRTITDPRVVANGIAIRLGVGMLVYCLVYIGDCIT